MDVQSETTHLQRPPGVLDVLRVPGLGRVLRWRYGRLVLQVPLLLLALLLVYDGFTGPQRAATNLATVVPWVHYRGFVVLALLLAGNLFCMGCPFTLPRTLAKRLSMGGRRFPRALRNKWLAIAGLLALFFLYEWLDMWSSPALTAWVIVAYFVASFVLEAVFSESAFCKYVCPLGTFNFVYSTASPTRIGARSLDVCRQCVGKECINGSYSQQPVIRINEISGGEIVHDQRGTLGCGTLLYVPQITSNLDCTLCLDCARACPHENVGLFVRAAGSELYDDNALPKRWDVSLLLIGLAFLGILNAFGMIPPVYDLMQDMARSLGLTGGALSDFAIGGIVFGLIFIIGTVALPLASAVLAATLGRALTHSAGQYTLRQTTAAFAPAFVPLGLGIWIGHYGFHFLIGAGSIVPVLQTFLIDHRITVFGTEPNWAWASGVNLDAIAVVQILALVGGFLWSMVVAQRSAMRLYRRRAPQGLLPWALLLLALMLLTVWIFGQPMEMRGTILFD